MRPDIKWISHPCYSESSAPNRRSIFMAIILAGLIILAGILAAIGWG